MKSGIFVFGSNRKGIHGAGAAYVAHHEYGAQYGVGEGPTGQSYALPTCSAPGVSLTLQELTQHVERFLQHAWNSNDTFWVTPVGCGIAGFTVEEVAPLFAKAPDNCLLPPRFMKVLESQT